MNIQRDNGVTCEKVGSDSFNMIHGQNTSARKLVEQYYFHFRVRHNELFRVFGYQRDQYFCITHLDPDGRVHH